MPINHRGLSVSWLGYATVRIEMNGGYVVYLDPGRHGVLDGYDPNDGDLVCVTHNHHYDSDGIKQVSDSDVTLVVYENVNTSEMDSDMAPPQELSEHVVRLRYGEHVRINGIDITAVEAYNHADGPRVGDDGEPMHPRGLGCGYHLDVEGIPIFWPGDSDVLESYADLDVSLLIPPIGGSFTMNRWEAADFAETVDPALVLPIHYDTFERIETDARAFAGDVASRGIPVVLDEAR